MCTKTSLASLYCQMRYILFSLLLPGILLAQKNKTGWSADTIRIRTQHNACLDFGSRFAGTMQQTDSRSWTFTPYDTTTAEGASRDMIAYDIPLYFYHSDAKLFGDCAYFDLLRNSQPHTKAYERERFYSDDPSAAASLRFYLDTTGVRKTIHDREYIRNIPHKIISPYYKPFYFRKYEVTNAEYREFVNWVLDSIARRLLVKGGFRDDYLYPNSELRDDYKADSLAPLNWKEKVHWPAYPDEPDYSINLEPLFAVSNERFYKRKSIDTGKLIYRFNTVPAAYGKTDISIYPDTLCWINDFSYSFNEPMTNMYFWHPAYDDYPVVGVNYWQCLAFLEWKSKMITQKLCRQGLRASCALPSEREWDLAGTAQLKDGHLSLFEKGYNGTCDKSWLTDLRITYDTSLNVTIYTEYTPPSRNETAPPVKQQGQIMDQVYIHKSNDKKNILLRDNTGNASPYRNFILQNETVYGDYIADGYFHTAPVSMRKENMGNRNLNRHKRKMLQKERERELAENARFQAHYDKQTGIYYMDGNVSEWMREDLDSNWRPMYEKHRILPEVPMVDQYKQVHAIEDYYYNLLPKHGKLVRGGNWHDERFTIKSGKNTAGIQAKTFVAPEKAHCTIGFRYVIYVEPVK